MEGTQGGSSVFFHAGVKREKEARSDTEKSKL
jgi:hypothetical protein